MSEPLQKIYAEKEFDWRAYSRLYEEGCSMPDSYYRLTARSIIERLAIKDHNTVIDAACGTGIVTDELYRSMSPYILGIDMFEEALAKFNSKFSKHPKVTSVKGNIETIDSYLDAADYIIAASAIWNFNYRLFFSNAARVLKQNGTLAFNVPASYLGEKEGFLYELAETFEITCNTGKKMFSLEDRTLQESLYSAGFSNVKRHSYRFEMSLDAIRRLFACFRLRAPFIFFESNTPFPERQIVVDKILAGLLEKWPKGHFEKGYVYLCKK